MQSSLVLGLCIILKRLALSTLENRHGVQGEYFRGTGSPIYHGHQLLWHSRFLPEVEATALSRSTRCECLQVKPFVIPLLDMNMQELAACLMKLVTELTPLIFQSQQSYCWCSCSGSGKLSIIPNVEVRSKLEKATSFEEVSGVAEGFLNAIEQGT